MRWALNRDTPLTHVVYIEKDCEYHVRVFFCVAREYISKNSVQFAKDNPQLTVYVRHRRGRHPRIIGEYCKSVGGWLSSYIVILYVSGWVLSSYIVILYISGWLSSYCKSVRGWSSSYVV